ncbi:C40 family peptidase [Paenibacillus kobensis]|uniref:C40 family peptidase n=1 Tax=Paenibacillus kobensis TaxID=59841 RepID=UPI000FD9F718|nr:NlpC/P60 family protein [Paenibacillus kobensis]
MRTKHRMLAGCMASLLSVIAAAFPYAHADASLGIEAQRDKVVATALELQDKVKYVHWQDRQEMVAPYKTDCSGYTYLVYRLANVGVKLINRDDDDQSHVGKLVTWGNFEKGDLLFFWNDPNNKGNVGHVGIYIGNGRMIHNADIGKDVVISDVNSSFYRTRFIVGRRVIY